jgi:hypothetical protein
MYPRPCRDPCERQYGVILFNIPLPYRYITKKLRCYQAQKPEEVRYQAQMEQIINHCKHKFGSSVTINHWIPITHVQQSAEQR